MSEKLKPCPFCGGKAESRCFMMISWIKCIECEASINVEPSLKKAIEAWNKRHDEPMQHAHWIEKSYFPDGTPAFICSRCGRAEPNKEPYCNCGAKMDGE